MKIYFPVQGSEANRSETLQALKHLTQKQFSGFKTDSLFSLSYDPTDQFFLKGPHAILWGRVYLAPFSDNDAELLSFELKRLQQILKQRIQAHIFFTEWAIKREGHTYPSVDYFRYRFIQSGAEKALMIEKVVLSGLEFRPDKGQALGPTAAVPDKSPLAKSAQLSREELAELIDLNLELKKRQS